MNQSSDERANLSVEEFKSALAELTQADMVYLDKKGGYFAMGLNIQGQDLLQEAIIRSLDGARHCPKDVPLRVFLSHAMQSIANGERKKSNWQIPSGGSSDPDDILSNERDHRPTPETEVMHTQQLDGILNHLQDLFEADKHAQAVILGMTEGWSAVETKELEPMDDKEHDAARQRVRRTIERYVRENENG